MGIRYRSIAMCIVLSLVTCGFYSIYWMYCIANDANAVAGESDTPGGTVILLTLVTCGLYGLYWSFRLGEKLDKARAFNNAPTGSLHILYLLLSIFGFSIVTFALAQNEINKYATAV